MTIFAIVVTYNGSKWVENCFKSLMDSSIPLKILAIDNCSTDGTAILIKKKFPEVNVIETSRNLGFGMANNIGLKQALEENADYAFLLNQDAWIVPDTIDKLLTIFNSSLGKDYGVISPIHLNSKGDVEEGFLNYLGTNQKILSDYILHRDIDELYPINFVNAAAFMITKDCLEQVGGFEPEFFHYGEDVNFFQRLKYYKIKAAIHLGSKIIHARDLEDKTRRKDLKSRFYFDFMEMYKFNILNINFEGMHKNMYRNHMLTKLFSLFISILRLKKNDIKYYWWWTYSLLSTKNKYRKVVEKYKITKGIYLNE
jgi:GT2 family glycosyltransferase